MDKVKVAIRVRPFNRREIELGTKCVVEMKENQTILHHHSTEKGESRKQPKIFAFDNCFWSFCENDPHYAGQTTVYNCLGVDLLANAFQGYNACIFAYGQTGSGKSFTMMGSHEDKGIIPKLCDNLFDQIANNDDPNRSYKIEVSFMEIYNEKVHDLLDPKGTKQNLKVREHNILGPYVDGLSILAVASFQDIDNLMQEGNKSRTVAATNMNNESSRSHAVFNVILTQTLIDVGSGVTGEKVAKISLVDLAGSERAVKTGAVGERLKEGSNINKSLTTLGLVISKLAEQSSTKSKDKFVPYRDSVLTWLLKDNLGGNSKTVMIATISPAGDNYEESLSTLRYADRAKRIVNHAVVNEDPNARIIRELRQEVEALKEQLMNATQREGVAEQLFESEKLMKQMSQTWEEKLTATERIHQERQQALEKMGISVQASGIKVEHNKYYLVNLNADPSLNELLVYYLKERTLVGRPDAPVENDIQLSGLGIMPEHCLITIENLDLYILPRENARTCVNGSNIVERTPLRHGDRVLWGNNHFFRVNCPKANTPSGDPDVPTIEFDYEFACEELMMKELSNDPIHSAMKALEKQHEEDKQGALEKQRRMYERQLQILRNQMSPSTPYAPYVAFDPLGLTKLTPSTPSVQSKVDKWARERLLFHSSHGIHSVFACYDDEDDLFKKSLAKLREDIVKANSLVREANFLAEEMGKQTEFAVTLQIPAANLSPNRKRGAFVSEPAILVKRKNKPSQVWPMDKLENKLIDMRDMNTDRKEKRLIVKDENPSKEIDPFYETQENHNLIGVANVFLEVLFHDVKLNYHVPIISQQGEVAGRLQVEISRSSGQIADRMNETSSEGSSDSVHSSLNDVSEESGLQANQITCRVVVKEATGLPPSLSNFVFCQYTFWGHPEQIVVAPMVNPDTKVERRAKDSMTFKFDNVKEFIINVNEEFIEHCTEGALSIEVWGNRSAGFGSTHSAWDVGDPKAVHSRSLADRWSELKRKIELRVEILELNDQGDYSPVEVSVNKPDIVTGGIYQLRQGQQRRILARVRPVRNSGTLPIICEAITSMAVGSVCARSKLQKGLDSYQEEDLTLLREKWSDCLMRRREYLDEHIQKMFKKQDKSDQDVEREQSLIDQWVCLTEERNAVLVPAAGSGIPGAPADGDPPLGMEKHIPVLFLDLNADDMSTMNSSGEGYPVAGANSILPKEQNGLLFNLSIVKSCDKDVCAVASWDSSIHDSLHLNRVTPTEERVYLILKVTVQLSHPAAMALVLRKRLCINVYKRQSLTEKLRRRMIRQETLTYSSVIYEVVSNIPKASEELEDRESLAQMAASGEDGNDFDGESYIEKYTRGVSAVESILTLDRLRQDVAIKELLAAQGRPLRKTASVPNISHILKFDGSPTKLDEQLHAESLTDISGDLEKFRRCKTLAVSGKSSPQEARPAANTFGLTASPQPTKFIKPMRTLLEEQYHREVTPLLTDAMVVQKGVWDKAEDGDVLKSATKSSEDVHASIDDDEFCEFESYARSESKDPSKTALSGCNGHPLGTPLGQSAVIENLSELQSKAAGTPSMVSSGYGSQAVSSTTLSSDDSLSIRSISVDETPDSEAKIFKDHLNGDKPVSAAGAASSTTSASEAKVTGGYVDSPLADFKRDADAEELPSDQAPKERKESEASMSALDEILKLHISEEDLVRPSTDRSAELAIIPPPASFSNPSSSPACGWSGAEAAAATLRPKSGAIRKNAAHRASYPFAEHAAPPEIQPLGQSKCGSSSEIISGVSAEGMDSLLNNSEGSLSTSFNGDDSGSVSSFGSRADLNRWTESALPEWVIKGESVLIRPYNSSGTIAFIGPTEFAKGVWIGVELDAPTGKNDGSVSGVQYFACRPRHGIFVRADKLIQDKRGRGMRSRQAATLGRAKAEGTLAVEDSGCGVLGRSKSKETLVKHDTLPASGMKRSKSRGEGLAEASPPRK